MAIALLAVIAAVLLFGPEPVRRLVSGFGRVALALIVAFLALLAWQNWWIALVAFIIFVFPTKGRGNGRRG
jgi:hypothetical protein